MSYRDELKTVATNLGIEFASNIPTTSLEEEVKNAGGILPEHTSDSNEPTAPKVESNKRPLTKREVISNAKKRAFAKRVVTITNKDNREADVATTAYLSFQNSFFELSRIVPLDIPVELEECLIKVAKSTNITLHKAEVVKGRPTGNQVPVTAKKYTISYNDQE